jgi:hypothetical protein
MNAEQIIRVLNNVDDKYILEASPEKCNVRHIWWRKMVGVAVCLLILISFSTVAYAANWFGIRDLLLPYFNHNNSIEKEETSLIGLSGYQGSAEWQALAEWQSFLVENDPEDLVYNDTEGRLDSSFSRYSIYRVYSQEMADEMDYISEKYGLKLHTTSYNLQEHKELIEELGNFLGDSGGYFTYMYEDGTFEVLGTIQYSDIGSWDFQLLRSVRGTFHDSMLDIGDISEYDETEYQAKCGLTVTLALGRNRVLIFADLADSFVTVTIPYGTDKGITLEYLQILADSIDFAALTPVKVPQVKENETQSINIETDSEAIKIFVATLRNLLYSNILPDGSIAEFPVDSFSQFAIYDVDCDGKEELILLYDSGATASAVGYIIGYDEGTASTYIQLEEYPYFEFLENGNLKALSSHNQTGGDMWPYILYHYLPETDTYELIGYAYSEKKQSLENKGVSDEHIEEIDVSNTGTVYYVGTDEWGTEPIDEADYQKWLRENNADCNELNIEYYPFTEENILLFAE